MRGLNREFRCDAEAVPPLYRGATLPGICRNLHMPHMSLGEHPLGRRSGAMILSQENCLFDAHRESTCDGEGSRVTVLRFWARGRLSLHGKPLFCAR